MATDAAEVRTAANGSIYIAPVGTTAPTEESAAYGAGWVDIGFASEDGVKFKDSKETRDQKAWQAFYPIGKKITGRSAMLNFVLMQWNKNTVKLAFGGGTISTPTAGHYKFLPPAPETVDYRAMGIDWSDGTLKYRLIVPRGLVTEDVETSLTRGDDALLPIAFEALPATAAADPWILYTNDASFA